MHACMQTHADRRMHASACRHECTHANAWGPSHAQYVREVSIDVTSCGSSVGTGPLHADPVLAALPKICANLPL